MADNNTLTLGLVQHASPGLDDTARQRNLDHCCDMIRDAASKGAQLVATQELFLTEYFCQIEDEARFNLAEPIPGPTTQRLGELAKELGIEITASLFEKRAAGVYHNTSVMIGRDGRIIDRYRKMHIPDDPRFYEKYYFTPGDPPGSLGWRAQQTTHAKTGMLICWDQWFPEAARLTAMHGAQVIFYPTAIGWFHGETDFDRQQQREAWQVMQRSHAIANGVFVAAINRVGTEGDLTFWGRSFVCDPGGVVLAEAPANDEAVLVVECDLNRIEALRRGWPFLRDRRIDAYQPLTQRLLDA
ncbi:MAG: carbon-nitrogen hydrolase [Phycisphaeraceae bacterium]